jgi:hypothetical protein
MIAIKRKTAVEAARLKAKRTHELVIVMLEMDETEHFEFMVDKAVDYLKKQCGPDHAGQQRLLGQDEFWAWWKNHWSRRDAQFMDEALASESNNLDDLKAYYNYVHSSDRLQSIRPHKRTMDKSFTKHVQPIIDREGIKCI